MPHTLLEFSLLPRGLRPLTLALTLLSLACGGGNSGTAPPSPPPPPPPTSTAPVASVSLGADSIDVALRAATQLTAVLRDAAGNTLSDRAVTWSATPAAVATVSATGLMRALQPGTASITATSEGVTATIRIRGTVAVLTSMVDSIRRAFGVPALGAAIVSREGMIGLGASGIRRVGSAPAVTPNDKWHLGSNTKALTGVLAGMAVDAGILRWDRTLETGLADVAPVMRAEYRTVTLTELFSHVGGLVNTTAGLPTSNDLPAARTAWAQYTVQQPPANARGLHYYSNNSYGVAGAMIERAWGRPYETLMADLIFTPLGIPDAGWGPTTPAGSTDHPVAHRRSGSAWIPCDGCDNPGGLSSAGTLHMSLTSWGRIVQELLLADQGRSTRLTQTTARYLTTNHVPSSGGASYGIGWGVSTNPANRFVTHDGSNTMNHSRATLFLDAGVAFLITTNAAEIPGITANALSAMHLRLDSYWINGR